MWSSKWVIADLITGSNVIEEAITQLVYRTGLGKSGTEAGQFTYSYVLSLNFGTNKIHILISSLAALFGSIIGLVKNPKTLRQNIVLLIISLSPFVWYFFTQNHAYIHYRFTYRNIAVLVFSMWMIAANGFFAKKASQYQKMR